jgi:hypothetical protein
MRDGIYKVWLAGGGVKVFMIGTLCDGRVTGCDQTHHVTGHVRKIGNRHHGEMLMERHGHCDGFVEIANMDRIEVSFTGICGTSVGEFDARIAGRPDLPVKASFQWICGL